MSDQWTVIYSKVEWRQDVYDTIDEAVVAAVHAAGRAGVGVVTVEAASGDKFSVQRYASG